MAGALEQASDALEPMAARASAKRLNDQVFRVCMLKAGFTEESQCVANCEVKVSEHEVNVFEKMKLLRSGMAMSTVKQLMGKPFYTGKPFYIEFSGSEKEWHYCQTTGPFKDEYIAVRFRDKELFSVQTHLVTGVHGPWCYRH